MTDKITKLHQTTEQKSDYTAMTFKELREWVSETVDYAEMVQGFDGAIPVEKREQFQGLTQSVFDCLECLVYMLDDKTLFYDRKLEQARLDEIKQEN